MHIAGQGNPAPFEEWRGDVGCLLLHGFPGSPAEVRELGGYLSERGVSVLAPLLPGHGREPEALRGVHWQDWVRAAAAGLRRLQERCEWVFACGLSMGGAISIYLAAEVPVVGVAVVSPAVSVRNPLARFLPLASHFMQWVDLGEDEDLADPSGVQRQFYYTRVPAMAASEMYRMLKMAWKVAPYVNVPALIVQSPRDAVLHPKGAQALYQRLPSSDKQLHWLERSGHNALVDLERMQIFGLIHDFIESTTEKLGRKSA